MAEFLHFSRDSRMFIVSGTGADTRAWSCPVLDGFSFSQATNASEITLGEMEDASGRSRRGRKMFTDSLSAAEFSFSTYVRPFTSAGGGGSTDYSLGRADDTVGAVHAVEEILWSNMAGQGKYVPATGTYVNNSTTGGAITSLGAPTMAAAGNLPTSGTLFRNVALDYTNATAGATVVFTVAAADITLTSGQPTATISPGNTRIKVGAAVTGASIPAGTTVTVVNAAGTSITMSANASGTTGDVNFSNTTAANAVVKVTAASASTVTAEVTERGIGFHDGDKIVLDLSQVYSGLSPAAAGTATIALASKTIVVGTTAGTDINFFDSNRSSIGEFDMYFILSAGETGRLVYRLKNAVINEASVDFDIDGIATINWSGMAGQIVDVSPVAATGAKSSGNTVSAVASAPTIATIKDSAAGTPGDIWLESDQDDKFYVAAATGGTTVGTHWMPAITEGTDDTANFIRNRLTQITLQVNSDFNTSVGNRYETSYNVPITSGNITISNNITFLTPEELGKVNQPLRHVTGSRTVTGSVNCYLGSSDSADNRSKNLFEDLVGDINTVINKFALTFDVGGKTGTPRLQFNMPLCHLEIPSHSIEDVISLETNFHALGSTIGESDEVTLKYFAS